VPVDGVPGDREKQGVHAPGRVRTRSALRPLREPARPDRNGRLRACLRVPRQRARRRDDGRRNETCRRWRRSRDVRVRRRAHC
jgi:hypothetical protein